MPETIEERIDDLLNDLPEEYVVAARGDSRFVAGRNGLFVVASALPEPPRCAERLHDLVEETRRLLCDHVTWVPFLDAIAVTRRTMPRLRFVTSVPIDMLGDVLREGREVVDTGILATIRTAVRTQELGGWMAGTARPGGKIDLCSPERAATTL